MRAVIIAALVLLPAACSSNDNAPARTERERDSILGQSQLPGAGGVRGSLGASDSAEARNARLDSIGQP